jgi:hypothetical protein
MLALTLEENSGQRPRSLASLSEAGSTGMGSAHQAKSACGVHGALLAEIVTIKKTAINHES